MPNKRAKGVKKAIFWLSNYEDEVLQKLANTEGTSRTNIFRDALMLFASKRGVLIEYGKDNQQTKDKDKSNKEKGE